MQALAIGSVTAVRRRICARPNEATQLEGEAAKCHCGVESTAIFAAGKALAALEQLPQKEAAHVVHRTAKPFGPLSRDEIVDSLGGHLAKTGQRRLRVPHAGIGAELRERDCLSRRNARKQGAL
jgi:hypothetical protein